MIAPNGSSDGQRGATRLVAELRQKFPYSGLNSRVVEAKHLSKLGEFQRFRICYGKASVGTADIGDQNSA